VRSMWKRYLVQLQELCSRVRNEILRCDLSEEGLEAAYKRMSTAEERQITEENGTRRQCGRRVLLNFIQRKT
jgi:hypothetical protein